MKTWTGTDKRDPDAIQRIDYFLRDVNAAMQRISIGQVPSGGGGSIGDVTDHGVLLGLADDDHLQYALLAGRQPGQTLYGSLDSGTLVLSACSSGTLNSSITLESGLAGPNVNFMGSHFYFAQQGLPYRIHIYGDAEGGLGGYGAVSVDGVVRLWGMSGKTYDLLQCYNAAEDKVTWVDQDGFLHGDGSHLTGTGTTPVDHDHTGDAGDGGNLSAYVHLAGAETITGLKTLTGAAASELFLNINSSDNFLAASLKVVPTSSPGNITLPVSDSGEDCILLGRTGEAPAAGELFYGTAVSGHVTPLAIGTAAQMLVVNPAGTLPEWVDPEDIGIATEEYVNAAVAQVINVASGSTLTVGTQTSGTYASTNVHDNTPWRVREAAATPGLNVELTFSAIPSAPTALWLRAYHNGQHTITVSIYKYTTSAWESYQVLPSAQSGYTFYSIPIPDGSEHISAGAARVQFAYTGEGSLDDYLYIDYCALVKAGLGSETIDVARTWETKQTFPAGTASVVQADVTSLTTADSPQFAGLNLGHASDTTLARTTSAFGEADATIEGNHIVRRAGTPFDDTLTNLVANAWYPFGDGGVGEFLVVPHAPGWYRVTLVAQITSAGSTGAKAKFIVTAYSDAIGTFMGGVIPMSNPAGAFSTNGELVLTATGMCQGSRVFYSTNYANDAGGYSLVSISATQTANGATADVYGLLEYLGA
jgi:hypothetical protein